ncbi:hypothetical protein JRQ81_016383 [Phrynocephalus forsythii]|uniref:DCN1-like protein n=1 Tax=Phrynocephalus forsythii TaxID=171643 RepID=A0A9Q0XSR3_9SAUR|nr:hypothetical protein JRQ81_016383 [Phrynocephalus forsythii]
MDGLTMNGVLVMHPSGVFSEDSMLSMWRDISVCGNVYALQDSHSAQQQGNRVESESDVLQEGSLINLCGVNLPWQTLEGLLRTPTLQQLEGLQQEINAALLQCPVDFSTLAFPSLNPAKGDGEAAALGNLTEDVGQDDRQAGSLRSCSSSDCFSKVMPPRKKRRPATGDDLSAKKSRHDGMYRKFDSTRIKTEDDMFSSKRCLEWFYEYAGTDDIVGPEGMEKFCEDIGVEPENVVMLVLAWKLDAQNMGYFTLQEWLKGMTSLQCDTTEKLRNSLDYLRSLLNEPTNFKLIYRYAFDFAREKDQRSLDINTAKCMLGLLLGKTWPLFPVFHQFLEQSKYKVINKDQWCNVLEFSRTINLDLSNYDEDGAFTFSFRASVVGRIC